MFKLMVGSGSVDYDNIVVDDDVDAAAAIVAAVDVLVSLWLN